MLRSLRRQIAPAGRERQLIWLSRATHIRPIHLPVGGSASLTQAHIPGGDTSRKAKTGASIFSFGLAFSQKNWAVQTLLQPRTGLLQGSLL